MLSDLLMACDAAALGLLLAYSRVLASWQGVGPVTGPGDELGPGRRCRTSSLLDDSAAVGESRSCFSVVNSLSACPQCADYHVSASRHTTREPIILSY